jgi:hypothetical protein
MDKGNENTLQESGQSRCLGHQMHFPFHELQNATDNKIKHELSGNLFNVFVWKPVLYLSGNLISVCVSLYQVLVVYSENIFLVCSCIRFTVFLRLVSKLRTDNLWCQKCLRCLVVFSVLKIQNCSHVLSCSKMQNCSHYNLAVIWLEIA